VERVTFRVPESVLDDVDSLVERGEYRNRSEAFRDALQELDGVGEPPERPSPAEQRSRAVRTDGGATVSTSTGEWGPFAPEMGGDAFGRWWSRVEEIVSVDWKQVFPPGMSELDATGFYVRVSLDTQLTGGTSVRARETRYNPALELAVQTGQLELGEDEDGEPVVRLPGGAEGYGRNGPGDDGD
jgi:Arc/MetJ-type ribon-helix-helix transcriptional regulator